MTGAHRVDPAEVARIAAAAEAADGVAPLDEAVLLDLRRHPDDVRSWSGEGGVALARGRSLDLVVAPESRGRGVGGTLLVEALAGLGAGEVLAWSHADHPVAARLADRHGFVRARELWVMRRPLADLPALAPRDGVTIRSYDPADAVALLAVNAAAFAHHPEQGALDAAGLADRMAEPWFDPAGLLLAVDSDGAVLGFHWTKSHSALEGEVYVVAVAPAGQGRGLGRLLTLAGLHHLAATGHTSVHLYVEGDNEAAKATYDRLGFVRAETHVQYRRP